MSESRLQEVRQALKTVYGGNGADHKDADRWLQQFQKSSEAWQIADALLMSSSNDLRETFFGAITIHMKIRMDFHELPVEAIPSLKQSLTNHLITWGFSSSSRPAVITRICLAIAALAVQTNWKAVIQDLSASTLQSASPDQKNKAARTLLELLQVLPEESSNKMVIVADYQREEFRSSLCSNTNLLFQYLSEIASGPLGQDEAVQKTIFCCLESWIRYTDIAAGDIAKFSIFQAAFDAIKIPELFDSAIDFLIEVLRTYCRPQNSMEIVSVMVPRAMSYDAMYDQSICNDDEDTARGLCRLFTEMGESYLDIIVSNEDIGQVALIKMLMKCTSHPFQEIASIPLHFWYQFCDTIENLTPKNVRDRVATMYSNYLEELVLILIKLIQYPQDLDQFSDDQVESYKGHRYNVADVINDICGVLGYSHVLKIIASAFENSAQACMSSTQGASWHPIEACLFAARSISTGILPNDESVSQILKIFPLLPENNYRLSYTAYLVVGRYSHWLKENPTSLGSMFQYLLNGFQYKECSAAAATAIKEVCQNCASLMGEPALSLYSQLQAAKVHIQFKDELEILEGLCSIAKVLPLNAALDALHNMAIPVVEGLSSPASLRSAQQDLDRLCIFLQQAPNPTADYKGQHPSIALLIGVWNQMNTLIERWPESIDLAEKICRCHKHALRTAGCTFSEPLVTPLAERIVVSFRRDPHHSPYLYCTNIYVSIFGEKTQHEAILSNLLVEQSRIVFHMMSSGLSQMIQYPDVVEEYFYLLARYLLVCPQILVTSGTLDNSLQLAVVGMALQHKEARCGVMHFISELVNLGSRGKASKQVKDAILPCVGYHGETIIRNLLDPIVNHDQIRSEDDSSNDCSLHEPGASNLLWRFHKLCPQYLQQWLLGALGGELKAKSLPIFSSFMESVCSEDATRESFTQSFRRLSRACVHLSRRWER